MRGETVLEYNGVTIRNCVTEQFQQEAVYDPTGTDLLYHKFTIAVTGICNGDDTTPHLGSDSFIGGGSAAPFDAAKQLVWLRSHLEKPRHRFTMRSGRTSQADGSLNNDGTYLLEVDPYQTPTTGGSLAEWKKVSPTTAGTGPGDKRGYDLNNGPKCTHCDILATISNVLFRVGVTFEICKLECETGDGRASTVEGVLSNRWSVTDDIDLNRMTNRSIHGRLRVTTPWINANHFRGWVVPALQDGFRRDSMNFMVTEDGLWLDYTINDKEIAYSAPQPATSWRMKHSSAVYNARESMTSISITLTADRDVSKLELLRTAYAIYVAKLLAGCAFYRTEELEMVDEYGDDINSVSLSARVAVPKTIDELKGGIVAKPFGGQPSTSIGRPIFAADIVAFQPLAANYDRHKSRGNYNADPLELKGSISLVSAWNAYLQKSCDDDHEIAIATGAQDPTFIPAKRHDYTLYGTAVASIPAQTNSTYLDNYENKNPYTNWQFESLFREQKIRAQMPIAAASSYFTSPSVASSVVVDLAGAVCSRIIRVTGTRIGKPPVMPPAPDKLPVGPSGSASAAAGMATLMVARIKPMTSDRTTDGQEIHTVSAEYEYAIPGRMFDVASGVMAQMFLGVNPWEAAASLRKTTPANLLGGQLP